MTVYVGTSGWQYASWRERFYPHQLAQNRWLEYYAERFATVEVDNTFYRLPEKSTFEQWAARTPSDFVFALKASRYLTHIRRLTDPADPVALLMERARGLGQKLGPILLQLPPTLKLDRSRLAETLEAFPKSARVAVEFRHESWFVEPVRQLLTDREVALCIPDRASKMLSPLWRTAAWTFVRFHEGKARPLPCYGTRALQSWVERIASNWQPGDDVYAYFNNDTDCCAVRDARRFATIAGRAGMRVTRVPLEPVRI